MVDETLGIQTFQDIPQPFSARLPDDTTDGSPRAQRLWLLGVSPGHIGNGSFLGGNRLTILVLSGGFPSTTCSCSGSDSVSAITQITVDETFN